MTKSCQIRVRRRSWTAAHDRIIRRDYPNGDVREIARAVGHSIGQTYARAGKLGVHKSAAAIAALRKLEGERLKIAGAVHRYPKGHVPANKGLRRPGWQRGRMAETWFKKGHRPHNYRWPVGSMRLIAGGKGKPYLFEKVSEAKPWTKAWVQLHRLVWRRAGRRIPPRHVLAFKDGNQLNCALENLECVHRRELARRNHWTRTLPKELQEVLALKIAIKRKLTMRGRDEQHRQAAGAPLRDARRSQEKRQAQHRARQGRVRGRRKDHRHSESRGRLPEGRRRPRLRVHSARAPRAEQAAGHG